MYTNDIKKYTEAFDAQWLASNINDPTNCFVILNRIIPWQRIINGLSKFYNLAKGPKGISLRIIVALFLVAKLRGLSDRQVIEQVRENRYIQYFCNVPDDKLLTFIHHSSLSKIRVRYGVTGARIIEDRILKCLRKFGIINDFDMLVDTTVLKSNIAYPTDIDLLYKGINKMRCFAEKNNIPIWWDDKEFKQLWREYHLNKKKEKFETYYLALSILYFSVFNKFKKIIDKSHPVIQKKSKPLTRILQTLYKQNEQKLDGQQQIKNRLVSLHELDARPIKKGKKKPSTEFGSKLQFSFNSQGFMISAEVYKGNPNDKDLYPNALKRFEERMLRAPDLVVADLGYRSQTNFEISNKVKNVFLGKSIDVAEDQKEKCKKARSATEGFIGVAKNHRNFACSLYKGLKGDKIWALLSQAAYNLKKFLQLYANEKISETSLIKLGFLT